MGFVFGIFAVIYSLVMSPDAQGVERAHVASGAMKKCPHCAELIRREAVKCRYCGEPA